MTFTTEDFAEYDRCPRFHQWNSLYQPLRISSHAALHEALTAAISGGDSILASERIMALAAAPGLDHKASNLYSSAVHHSKLAETLATYALSVDSKPLGVIPMKWGDFQPESTLLSDGRLRRFVLADRWSPEREQIEKFNWRTAADCAVTNRPMVVTALMIAGIREGFRPCPWTQGFVHPKTGETRIQKRSGNFTDSWRKVYRENSGLSALEWLKIIQSDKSFPEIVFSFTAEVPKDREQILEQMAKMVEEMSAPIARQTRSACYRFTPCPFLQPCATATSPAQLGWTERDSPSLLPVVS